MNAQGQESDGREPGGHLLPDDTVPLRPRLGNHYATTSREAYDGSAENPPLPGPAGSGGAPSGRTVAPQHSAWAGGGKPAGEQSAPFPSQAGEPIPEPKRAGGGPSSLLKSSAVMAAGTIVSRSPDFSARSSWQRRSASAPSTTPTRSPMSCPR